jgi:hypothetical protein
MLQTELEKDLGLISNGEERESASQGAKSTGTGPKPLTPLCTKGYERLDIYLHKAKVS